MVKVVYCMTSNLLKRNDMEVGQVSFHQPKQVKSIKSKLIFTKFNYKIIRKRKAKR